MTAIVVLQVRKHAGEVARLIDQTRQLNIQRVIIAVLPCNDLTEQAGSGQRLHHYAVLLIAGSRVCQMVKGLRNEIQSLIGRLFDKARIIEMFRQADDTRPLESWCLLRVNARAPVDVQAFLRRRRGGCSPTRENNPSRVLFRLSESPWRRGVGLYYRRLLP
jgi:hypothetical protein